MHKKVNPEGMEGVFGTAKFYHLEGERYLEERDKDLEEIDESL